MQLTVIEPLIVLSYVEGDISNIQYCLRMTYLRFLILLVTVVVSYEAVLDGSYTSKTGATTPQVEISDDKRNVWDVEVEGNVRNDVTDDKVR